MALIAGAVAAGSAGVAGLVGGAVGIIKRYIDRYVIVANDTPQPILVTVEHKEGKNSTVIEPGESMKFTVSNNKPITIKVQKCTKNTYDAEVSDYDYRNFIVRKATTGDLVLIRAKKWKVWEEEEPSRKQGDRYKLY